MTQYCIISATSSGGGRDQKNVFAAVVQTTPALKPLGRGRGWGLGCGGGGESSLTVHTHVLQRTEERREGMEADGIGRRRNIC